MNWYRRKKSWNGRVHDLYQQLSERDAEELGAELVPGFDPSQPVAGIVSRIVRDGNVERGLPLTAEIPGRRQA